MTCYFPFVVGDGGPATVAGASARQGTSPFLADRDIRARDPGSVTGPGQGPFGGRAESDGS